MGTVFDQFVQALVALHIHRLPCFPAEVGTRLWKDLRSNLIVKQGKIEGTGGVAADQVAEAA